MSFFTSIVQTYPVYTRESLFVPPKPLTSQIRLPHAPQFWIEIFEGITNWLVRVLKMVQNVGLERTSYQEITVDPSKFAPLIWEHVYRFEAATGEHPAYVFVGRDIYRTMMDEIHRELSFMCEWRRTTRWGEVQYMGVTVVCLPWMKGILAVPNLDNTRH